MLLEFLDVPSMYAAVVAALALILRFIVAMTVVVRARPADLPSIVKGMSGWFVPRNRCSR